jgi:hypothetical protein
MFTMMAALDPLGSPPSVCNDYVSAVKIPWGMYGNDSLGDCVPADTAHALMLRTANVGSIIVPQLSDVIKLYENVGGYDPNFPFTDQGCEETAMTAYMASTGFLGHKADAVCTIDDQNYDHLRWAIQLFGTCRIGLNLPGFAEDQFDANVPWDISATGDQKTNGHDVPLVKYLDADTFLCVTWGRLQPIKLPFLEKYCEEAHAELYGDWIQAQGSSPPGLDLNTLASKLQELQAA